MKLPGTKVLKFLNFSEVGLGLSLYADLQPPHPHPTPPSFFWDLNFTKILFHRFGTIFFFFKGPLCLKKKINLLSSDELN